MKLQTNANTLNPADTKAVLSFFLGSKRSVTAMKSWMEFWCGFFTMSFVIWFHWAPTLEPGSTTRRTLKDTLYSNSDILIYFSALYATNDSIAKAVRSTTRFIQPPSARFVSNTKILWEKPLSGNTVYTETTLKVIFIGWQSESTSTSMQLDWPSDNLSSIKELGPHADSVHPLQSRMNGPAHRSHDQTYSAHKPSSRL